MQEALHCSISHHQSSPPARKEQRHQCAVLLCSSQDRVYLCEHKKAGLSTGLVSQSAEFGLRNHNLTWHYEFT